VTSAACHTTGAGDSSGRLPWSGDPRAAAKTELLKYARQNPTGVRPTVAARAVLDPETRGGDRDARFSRRFYENHPDLFKTTRQGRDTWVEPRPAAFHLNRGKHRAKNGDGGGTGYDTDETPGFEGGRTGENGPEVASTEEDDGPREFAKDRARSFLSGYSSIGSDATRADLLAELGTELTSIEDRVTVMERVRGSGPDYLLAPYRTRFNSPARVAENRERFEEAFDRATERFEEAVVVTLTTDPGRHDSILDATDALLENKNRLSAWLSYDPENGPSRPGYRSPNVYALEFTDSGLPHLHVAYFGVRWLVPQETLAEYWRDRGQGEVVHVRQAAKRGDEFVLTGKEDGRRPTVRRYFSKTLRDLSTLSGLSPEEVEERAAATQDGEGGDLWKLALLWATGKRLWDGSPSLTSKESKENEGWDGEDSRALTQVPRYRFVGVSKYNCLPGFIRRNSCFHNQQNRKPPPNIATGRRFHHLYHPSERKICHGQKEL